MAAATTPAPTTEQIIVSDRPIRRFPPTQPPSLKPADYRKTQLHRQYQSMLRSSPIILLFQHNNIKSAEWVSIQRELTTALLKADAELAADGRDESIGRATRFSVIQTGIFTSALRVVEFWNPKFGEADEPATGTAGVSRLQAEGKAHGVSIQAWRAQRNNRKRHGFEALMSGPIAALTLPVVSPHHVKAALSILAPDKAIPAPKRKAQPSLYEAPVQNGLQKLLLLGARIDGKVFDFEGARWVAGIQGGLPGLQAQLVAMLQGVGAGLTSTLESAGRNLYMTVEGRRGMLEEEEKGGQA